MTMISFILTTTLLYAIKVGAFIAPSTTTRSSMINKAPPPSHYHGVVVSRIKHHNDLNPSRSQNVRSCLALYALKDRRRKSNDDTFTGVVFNEDDFLMELERLKLENQFAPTTDEKSLTTSVNDSLVTAKDTNNATQLVVENVSSRSVETSEKQKELWFARGLVLVSAMLYGTNFTFVKMLDEVIPNVGAASALRFSLASLATIYWMFAPTSKTPPPVGASDDDVDIREVITNNTEENGYQNRWGVIQLGMEIGLWNLCGYMAQAVGLQTTDASKSAFICSLAVIIVPILDWLSGKSLKQNAVVGAMIALFGVGLLEMGGSDFTGLTAGDWASLVQPLAFGVGFWRMESAMHKYPTEASRLTAAQLFTVAVGSISYCLLGGGGVNPPSLSEIATWLSDTSVLASLIWTGVVTTALTIYMETRALKTVSAAEATVLFSTEPLWGSVCASTLLGEQFGLNSILGGVLILAGILKTNINEDGKEEISSMKNHEKANETATSALSISGGLGVANLISQLQNAILQDLEV